MAHIEEIEKAIAANAEELLLTTPKAVEPFRVLDILQRNIGSNKEI